MTEIWYKYKQIVLFNIFCLEITLIIYEQYMTKLL